jgi:hypothetical protein
MTEDAVKRILFDKQKICLSDKEPFLAALCTRRAGKSYYAGAKLFISALRVPNSISIYIALTRSSARNIMWQILLKIAERAGIKIEETESKLTIKVIESNSEIQLVGADTKNFIERLRGTPYACAIIDEAGTFRDHLNTLVDDVLTPSMADYNGQICLIGTPSVRPQGMFYDATQGKTSGWSVHKWSVFDNPYMPNARSFVDGIIKRRGWTKENPTYLREWCGIWVEDLDALVYKFRKEKNEYSLLPTDSHWNRILSVDYGWHDKTAFAVVAYNDKAPNSYVEYAKGYSELIPSQIAEMLEKLIKKYNPIKIVADTGGLGKSITEEMRIRYGLPIIAAEKKDKLAWISLINGAFIDRQLFINKSLEELKHQYSILVKDEDGLEDPIMPNDLCDAVLYAWRESRAHQAIPDKVYKSKEDQQNAMMDEYWESEAEKLELEKLKEIENEGTY